MHFVSTTTKDSESYAYISKTSTVNDGIQTEDYHHSLLFSTVIKWSFLAPEFVDLHKYKIYI
jgi:hypothetical protein